MRTPALRRALVAVALVAVTLPFASRPAGAQAEPVAQGLTFESHSTFRLDVPGRAVRVSVAMVLTNNQPDIVTGSYVRTFYFPRVVVPVGSEATNAAAVTGDGTALPVSLEPTGNDAVSIASLELQPALSFGQTQSLTLTYDLPAQPPRSRSATRVNDAFASFVVFGRGDPGITSVQVVVPSGTTVDVAGAELVKASPGDGTDTYTADAIADPQRWGAGVSVKDDSKLVRRSITAGDHAVEVRGWPDDPAWADFVDKELRAGLPVLQDLIGRPWPYQDSLGVTETASPYLYGYAGWYDTLERRVEIGDELAPIVVLHEVGHVWFNRDLFSGRWISEGLAEAYGTVALQRLGQPVEPPPPVDRAADVAFPLAEWDSPTFQDASGAAREAYGYGAAYGVIRQVVDELGPDRMRAVIAAAADGRIAYVGGPAPEAAPTPQDWRTLLDLLEEQGRSAKAAELWATYVAGPSDAAMLAARADARAQYAALAAAGEGWTPPLQVRRAMSAWSFDDAEAYMAKATEVLLDKEAVAAAVAPLGLGIPAAVRRAYEAADDLDGLASDVQAEERAGAAIVAADRALNASHGLVGAIGLFGGRADRALRDAKAAFDRNDPAAAVAAAQRAQGIADRATKAGVLRLVALAALIAAVLLAWRWGLSSRRRGPGAAQEPAAPATAGAGEALSNVAGDAPLPLRPPSPVAAVARPGGAGGGGDGQPRLLAAPPPPRPEGGERADHGPHHGGAGAGPTGGGPDDVR